MLPNFFGLGAQKCGTTSLVQYLRPHPEIHIPDTGKINSKEINFFFHDDLYRRGLSFYESFFVKWSGEEAVGEISPDYLYHPVCLRRIRKHFKSLKFIILLRNPIDRAYSNYWMEKRRGNENLSFSEAIECETERIKKGRFERDTFSYQHRGYYFDQIKTYKDFFPESRFLIMLSDDLKHDRLSAIQQVFEFLGVDPNFHPDLTQEYHTASKIRWESLHRQMNTPNLGRKLLRLCIPSYSIRQSIKSFLTRINVKHFTPPPMDDSIRQKLRVIFAENNEKLAELIGRDLSHWT